MKHLTVELARRLIHGHLDAPARAHWERHLRDCPPCRALLARERAWSNLLDLGDPAGAPPAPGDGGPPPPAMAAPPPARPGRSRGSALLAAGLATAGLAAALGWQLAAAGRAAERAAQELRVPRQLEAQVAANLPALVTLAHEPWLVEDYETVRALEELLAGHGR